MCSSANWKEYFADGEWDISLFENDISQTSCSISQWTQVLIGLRSGIEGIQDDTRLSLAEKHAIRRPLESARRCGPFTWILILKIILDEHLAFV